MFQSLGHYHYLRNQGLILLHFTHQIIFTLYIVCFLCVNSFKIILEKGFSRYQLILGILELDEL